MKNIFDSRLCQFILFTFVLKHIYIHYIHTYSHILLYTASWRYRRDYLQASIDTLFYIMFYIINKMKKHKTLLFHVRSYNTKKVPI